MSNHRIEQIAPGDLEACARNARTLSKKQLRQIAGSIETFGFTNPVLIDSESRILAGHGRVAAAKMLGMWDLRNHAAREHVEADRLALAGALP